MQPSAAASSGDRHRTAHTVMNNDLDVAFFAAEAAAESTVDRLYKRAAEDKSPLVGLATVAIAATGLAAVAAWKSPLGVKVRAKVAKAIAPSAD